LTATVSSVPGGVTSTPAVARIALTTARIAARIQNSQNEWGSLLPTHSIASRARKNRRIVGDSRVSALAVVVDVVLVIVPLPRIVSGVRAERDAGSAGVTPV
jgi:hypothetical protein